MSKDVGITEDQFAELAREYRRRWQVKVCAVSPEGQIVFGQPSCLGFDCRECEQAHVLAIDEALRWGEPTIGFCARQRLLWAVPLMRNEKVLGGLIASVPEKEVFVAGPTGSSLDVRRACVELRQLTERENLTDASALALSRKEYQDEQQRAYAIHSFKTQGHT